jgi:hypothetical protein
MQPEDIDKLFRDQLHHHAPTPPAYLWDQLEAELQPARKRPTMWLYAAAAMIALLIMAGGTWMLRSSDSDAITGSLATTANSSAASTTGTSQILTPTNKSAATQATAASQVSSSGVEGRATTSQVAATTPSAAATGADVKRVVRPAAASAVARQVVTVPASTRAARASQPVEIPGPAVAATPASTHPERPAGTEVAALASTPVLPAPTGAIEVEVHRGTDAPVALAAADAPQSYESDSHLKNLFHKAKTAVQDGRVKLPKVELPETVTVQVNVFNHSATKVIQL